MSIDRIARISRIGNCFQYFIVGSALAYRGNIHVVGHYLANGMLRKIEDVFDHFTLFGIERTRGLAFVNKLQNLFFGDIRPCGIRLDREKLQYEP